MKREEARRGPRPLGEVLREVLRSRPMPRRGEIPGLLEAWVRAAGPEVAKRSRPVRLRGGELVVSFESPVLRHEVQGFRTTEILDRMRAELPTRRIATLKCVLNG